MMRRTALMMKRAREIMLENENDGAAFMSTLLGTPQNLPVVESSPDIPTNHALVHNGSLESTTKEYQKDEAVPSNSVVTYANLLPVQFDLNTFVENDILYHSTELEDTRGSPERFDKNCLNTDIETGSRGSSIGGEDKGCEKNSIVSEVERKARNQDNIPPELAKLEINETDVYYDEPEEEVETQGRPKKGRKRKFPLQNRHIRKLKCVQNKTYYTERGNVKLKKEFRQFLCRCDCLSKVGLDKAKEEYEKFYRVSSHDAQRALICAMVSECSVKRKRVKGSIKRSFSRAYKVNGVIVCKTFFLQTFRISSGKIDLALKSKKRPEGVKDLRGIGGGKNKISNERFQEVVEHIHKFPKYKSHYARAQTESLYLRSDTTLPVMYDLYKKEAKYSPVSFSKYKNIFLTRFNLKRKPLKKDTCNTCDKLVILTNTGSSEEQSQYKIEKENHLRSAQEARSLLKADRKKAEEDASLEVLCFDLEKTLPLPRIPTNVVFYKRQLWLYNLGIHTGKKNKGHCYVWLEGEAGRGAQEVGSCLFRHIMEDKDLTSCKHLILWSDSCGGQNRNIKMALMLKAVLDAHPLLEKITLRFLTSGHSFLPNDTDFGDIECALKLQQRLYSPEDYINIMKSCRRKNPLVVHQMEKENFFSTADLEKSIVNRKTDIFNNKINWLKFKEIESRKANPYSLFVKSDFGDEALEINMEKKRGRPSATKMKFNKLLKGLWPNGKPIPEKKLEDLKFLMHLIPKDAKQFYKNLVGDPNIEEDIDGFDGHIDFDIEEGE